MKVPVDLGPVQLLVFGFDQPKFGGGIAAELNRLKTCGSIHAEESKTTS
jgi:hypothetical protein